MSNYMHKCLSDAPKIIFKLYASIMFGAMHFIYYINKSIATKVDSTYLGH